MFCECHSKGYTQRNIGTLSRWKSLFTKTNEIRTKHIEFIGLSDRVGLFIVLNKFLLGVFPLLGVYDM